MGRAAAALFPDLGSGPKLVGKRIRRVRVLIDVHVAVRVGCGAPLRLADRAVCAFERIGEDELGTECARDALALERDLVRHAELEGIAGDGADHGERDSGVAARRLEHDAPATEPALLLRIQHHPQRRPVLHASTRIGAFDLRPELAAQSCADAVQWDERRFADLLEDRSAHALADDVSGQTGHAERLPGPRLDPDRLQRAPGKTQRFIRIAARLSGARPPIEDHPEEMRRTLLGKLPGLLECPPRGGPVGLHAELTSQDQHADLRIRLIDLARELQRCLRLLETGVGVGLCQHLRLRSLDRSQCASTLRLFSQPRGAREALASACQVPVVDVQRSRVIERAGHLIQKPKVLIDIEALLVTHDRRLDVSAVVVGLRDTGIKHGDPRKIVE